jgi:hypothetical protein
LLLAPAWLRAALVPAVAAGARPTFVAGFVATAGVVEAPVGVLLALALGVGDAVAEGETVAETDGVADGVWLGDDVAEVDGAGDVDDPTGAVRQAGDVVGAPCWGVGPTPGSTAPCEWVCVWADPPPTLADAPGPPARVDVPVELAGEMTWVTLMDM